eukprot:CAMPEP_0183483258 /NCGR_PEP_ID=MMETSP0370-20130417/177999_1 /TAXON_ID=268820 /ORGANISM="Peridinium aciculiferum, Strain PAER-2" /LENGTH=42 /DNA_ID= /DNA_START= /DNA_END= /DNA_ORIENTATION=
MAAAAAALAASAVTRNGKWHEAWPTGQLTAAPGACKLDAVQF